MSRRASVYVVRREKCDGGEWPNTFRAQITVEVRVFWPPDIPLSQVAAITADTCYEAINKVVMWEDDIPRKSWLRPPITTTTAEELDL